MSKRKIYKKLFEHSDIKTWKYDTKTPHYYSEFYNDYRLSFEKKRFFWGYYIYEKNRDGYLYNKYNKRSKYHSFFVPNNAHKISISIVSLILLTLYNLINFFSQDIDFFNSYFLLSVLFLIITVYIIYPLIFISYNWTIYKIFFKCIYNIGTHDAIKRREEIEHLEKDIKNTINSSLSDKQKRKTKLKKLKKKRKIKLF